MTNCAGNAGELYPSGDYAKAGELTRSLLTDKQKLARYSQASLERRFAVVVDVPIKSYAIDNISKPFADIGKQILVRKERKRLKCDSGWQTLQFVTSG